MAGGRGNEGEGEGSAETKILLYFRGALAGGVSVGGEDSGC